MSTFETSIELNIEVEFVYTPAERGSRDRWGIQEEPDFDAEIEITKVTAGKLDITELLTDKQMEDLEEQAFKEVESE